MNRRDKHNYYLDMADVARERGTCLRRNYGAVIVKNDVIVSTGYVGAPRGRAPQAPKDPATMSFEDKLKAFMSDSESRQADVRHATDRKNGSRRRR